jgi:hypothetical protein
MSDDSIIEIETGARDGDSAKQESQPLKTHFNEARDGHQPDNGSPAMGTTTIRDVIERLERRRDLLNAQIMDETDGENRNRGDSEIRAVESALKFHRETLETTRRVAEWNRQRSASSR